jgi:hypothetical protein
VAEQADTGKEKVDSMTKSQREFRVAAKRMKSWT